MEDHELDISRMHQVRITINRNGRIDGGRHLQLRPEWSLENLLYAAEKRLDLDATPSRVFNSDGMEITDLRMIEDGAIVFVSHGAGFIPPRSEGEEKEPTMDENGIPTLVAGYKVLGFLGRGGFGEVRVGEHQLTGERVALKLLRKSDMQDIGAAERTSTEIQCLTALRHPGIIRLIQRIETTRFLVLAFELMAGGDLFNYLVSLPTQKLSEEEGRPLFHQVVSAVGYAHNQHICHRDLKLENLLLQNPNQLDRIKIADFGLSDFYRPGATMRTNCGSLGYLAPEVFRGTSNAGPPLDVWSLGVILFAVLCGHLPFEGTELSPPPDRRPTEATVRKRILQGQIKLDYSLSPEAKDLLRRMLKVDPNERLSIPEVLTHCWLRHHASGGSPYASVLADIQPSGRQIPPPINSSSESSRTPQIWSPGGSTPPIDEPKHRNTPPMDEQKHHHGHIKQRHSTNLMSMSGPLPSTAADVGDDYSIETCGEEKRERGAKDIDERSGSRDGGRHRPTLSAIELSTSGRGGVALSPGRKPALGASLGPLPAGTGFQHKSRQPGDSRIEPLDRDQDRDNSENISSPILNSSMNIGGSPRSQTPSLMPLDSPSSRERERDARQIGSPRSSPQLVPGRRPEASLPQLVGRLGSRDADSKDEGFTDDSQPSIQQGRVRTSRSPNHYADLTQRAEDKDSANDHHIGGWGDATYPAPTRERGESKESKGSLKPLPSPRGVSRGRDLSPSSRDINNRDVNISNGKMHASEGRDGSGTSGPTLPLAAVSPPHAGRPGGHRQYRERESKSDGSDSLALPKSFN